MQQSLFKCLLTQLFHRQRFAISRDDKGDGRLYFAKRDSETLLVINQDAKSCTTSCQNMPVKQD